MTQQEITIEDALVFTTNAFRGFKDKGGNPYIHHCIRVMMAVEFYGYMYMIVALMHDVLEDTKYTVEDLWHIGVPEKCIEAIIALTKTKNMSKLDSAKLAARNPISKIVKIADLRDNMNLSRIKNHTEADIERNKKYSIALNYLLNIKSEKI